MPTSRACLCLLLASCTGSLEPWLTEDQREAFAVLDDFDSLDTARLPFVRVSTEAEERRTDRYGFLLRTEGRTLHVRYLDLCRDVVELRPAEEPRKPRVWFEPVDLRDHVRAAVAAARAVGTEGVSYYCWPETPMPPDPLLLLLARACARRGLREEVAAIWDALPEGSRTIAGLREAEMHVSLARGLAERVVLDFADPEIPWRELMRRHDAWLDHFPTEVGSRFVAEQRDALAELLATGIEEPAVPWTTAEELVAALRAAPQHEPVRANWCWPVGTPGAGPRTASHPAARLEQLGLAAVPALLAVLDDHSPTRSALYCCRHGGGYSVLRLGDLAHDVLESIAGYRPDARDRAAGWSAWFERARAQGIRRVLLEETRRMDATAMKSLLRRWPEDLPLVLDSLRAAARAETWGVDYVLCALTSVECAAAEPRVPELFREVLHGADDLDLRRSAAHLLLDHDPDVAVAAMTAAWRSELAKPEPDGLDLEHLAQFLVRSGTEAAWRAFADSLEFPAARTAFASLLYRLDWSNELARVAPSSRPVAEKLLRTCLHRMLRDEASLDCRAHVGAGAPLETRREAAAWVFASTWPEEFPVHPLRPKDVVRRRQR